MQLFFIHRPGVAAGANDLDAALTRLRAFEETPSASKASWLHSYALREADGRLGLACVFQADSVQTLLQHAKATQLPAAEVLPVMQTLLLQPFAPTRVYLIRRRSAWQGTADFERCATAARRVAEDDMPSQVSWLHSYSVREPDHMLGSVCLYQGATPQALARHALRSGMPAGEITTVIGRIVFRQEPLNRSSAFNATAV